MCLMSLSYSLVCFGTGLLGNLSPPLITHVPDQRFQMIGLSVVPLHHLLPESLTSPSGLLPATPLTRPLLGPSGQNPLPSCGSVFHHALIYVKQGSQIYRMDFGPADGADVTANIM